MHDSEYIKKLAFKLIDIWKSKESDENVFEEFSKLNKDEMNQMINIFIEELEEIKNINKLIRIQESINVMFDIKIIYINLKAIMIES